MNSYRNTDSKEEDGAIWRSCRRRAGFAYSPRRRDQVGIAGSDLKTASASSQRRAGRVEGLDALAG